MKKERKIIAILLAFALILGGIPMGFFGADATSGHECDVPEDCLVCTVANMINELPAAEDITVDNAAAVTEKIHAIDRVKYQLTDDEYDELLTMVDNKNDGSGYGQNVPTLYMDAIMKVTALDEGGSFLIAKENILNNMEFDHSMSNASFTIEALDSTSNFEPLSVTLADINDSFLEGTFYSQEETGWTNEYIVPAGRYKITETDYEVVTKDGQSLTTTASYSVGGVETTDSAIVEVREGQQSIVTVYNSHTGEDSVYPVNLEATGYGWIDAENTDKGHGGNTLGEDNSMESNNPGDLITITANPSTSNGKEHVLYNIIAKDSLGNDLTGDIGWTKVNDNDNVYQFTMPEDIVWVYGLFVPKTIDVGISDGEGNLLVGTLELYAGTDKVGSCELTSADKVWEIDSTKLKLDTTYTIKQTAFADGFYCPDGTYSIKLSGTSGNVSTEGLTQSDTGVYTLANAKVKLTGFESLAKITIANGTAVEELKAQLPSKIKLVTNDTYNEYEGTVTWDENGFNSYDPSNRNKQTFTVKGTVALPDSIDQNQVSLEVEQEFEVSSRTERKITVNKNEFGSLTTTDAYTGTDIHYAGNEISVAATAKDGYVLHTLTVKTASGSDITVTQDKFTMPDEDVEINAVFVPKNITIVAVDEAGDELTSAKLIVLNKDNAPFGNYYASNLVINSKTLNLGETYTVLETTIPDGYYIAQGTRTFAIGPDGKITYTGLEEDTNNGILLLKNYETKVSVSAVDEFDAYVENADITIYDSNDNVVQTWKSGTEKKVIKKLKIGKYHIVAENTDDYYPATSEKIDFEIGHYGKVTKDGTTEYENGTIEVVFKKYDKYDIVLTDQNIQYGGSLDKANLVNFGESKLNGVAMNEEEQSKLLAALEFTVSNGTTDTPLDKVKELPVGYYTLKAVLSDSNEYPNSKFNIIGAEVNIDQRTLTADDFDITVTEKEYGGGSEAIITATLKEAVLGIKDDIKVIINGTYDETNAGDGITVDYTISGLESESGLDDNYKLDGGAITGQTTGSIAAKPIENINVTFDKPEENKEFDTSVTVDDDAVSGTISWKVGDEAVSGKVEYDTEYTAVIELSTDGNHVFTEEDTKLKVNGEESAFVIVDGKLLIEMRYIIANPNNNIDTDGDGKPDVNIDTDGDGKPDVNVDTDGDGKPDVNIDTDGDGKPDINIDTDGDGKPDVNIDTDGDGKPDVNIDTDGDGKPDVNIDTDGDGKPDVNIDTDGDGKPDVNIDTDGDGKPDVNIDTDGDGKPDVNIDTDGDGKPDVNIDTDGDGKPDVNIDTDGDGKPDVNIDTDGDGKPDVNVDKDGDGKPDVNGDGTGNGTGNGNGAGNGTGDGTGNISGGNAGNTNQGNSGANNNTNSVANGVDSQNGNSVINNNSDASQGNDGLQGNDANKDTDAADKDEESVDAFKEGVEDDDSEDASKNGIGNTIWTWMILIIVLLAIALVIWLSKRNKEEK